MCMKIKPDFFWDRLFKFLLLVYFYIFFSYLNTKKRKRKMDIENTDDILISAYQAELKFFKSILASTPWHCPAKSTVLYDFLGEGWSYGNCMKSWLCILSWREELTEKNSISEKLIPGSEQRNWLCGKMETLKIIMFVLPRRIMTSLCPEKVMLKSFCSKQNHVAWLQRDFALNVQTAGRSRIRTRISKIKQKFKKGCQ